MVSVDNGGEILNARSVATAVASPRSDAIANRTMGHPARLVAKMTANRGAERPEVVMISHVLDGQSALRAYPSWKRCVVMRATK